MATRKKKRERVRGKRRENRHERRKETHSGGGDYGCVDIPGDLDTFKPEAKKTYHIDVLPYVVGDLNKNADNGDEYFELSYACYNGLGIDDKRYLAISEMMGVRDPVAEHFANLRKQGAEWDDMKDFKPKWRQMMLIFVHEQAEKGLQIFEGAYGSFGELLDEEIGGEEEEYIDNFDDPDAGATLEVRFKGKNIGMKNPWVIAGKINFEERDNGFDADGDDKLAEEILEQVEGICLDECLRVPDYDTLKAALDGAPVDDGDEDDEEEKPARRKRKARRKPEPEEPDEDETDEEEEEEEPVKPKRKPKRKPKPEPEPEPEEEDDGEEGDLPWDDEDAEDGEELPSKKKAKAKKKPTKRKPKPEPEEDADEPETEEEEEEEEEEPKPKAKKKTAKKKPAKKKPEPKEEDDDDDWDDNWDE